MPVNKGGRRDTPRGPNTFKQTDAGKGAACREGGGLQESAPGDHRRQDQCGDDGERQAAPPPREDAEVESWINKHAD